MHKKPQLTQANKQKQVYKEFIFADNCFTQYTYLYLQLKNVFLPFIQKPKNH